MKDFGWIQKLHSSLIDVLREHHEDCLIELGMPQRVVTHSDIPPAKGIFFKPYHFPIVLIAGNEDQPIEVLEEILREALLSHSIDPGEVFTYTQVPNHPLFTFKSGVWFPIKIPDKSQSFNLGVFLTESPL